MAERGLLQGVADEGGWWPAFSTNEQALDTLMLAIDRAGRAPGDEVAISLDVAASEFGRDGLYRLGLEKRELDRDGLAEMLLGWCARYPIVSIEDPFAEDDVIGFQRFDGGGRRPHSGDRRRPSCHKRRSACARRRTRRSANAVLIKVNQAGTVSGAEGGMRRRLSARLWNDRLRAFRRDRGRIHRPSRDRLGRRPAQGRLVRPLGANGEMERGSAHRGGAAARRRASPGSTACPRPEWAGAMARDSAVSRESDQASSSRARATTRQQLPGRTLPGCRRP